MSWFLVALQGLLAALALLFTLPAAVLLGQVLLALMPRRADPVSTSPPPRVAVMVPAHNESAGLLPTLGQVRAQLGAGDRLLVVADNCTDDTAALARAAGAEVIERVDARLRGKGYALDFGVRHLEADPPDVLVVVDADCTLEPLCIERLAQACQATGLPVQATFLTSAAHAGLKMRVAEFAMRVKVNVRPRGMARAGLPCNLMGSGIAYPWSIARTAPLASGHLAEDVQLGIELGRRGTPPRYCEPAVVRTIFADNREAQATQRTRWEHGHLALLVNEGPGLLARALVSGRLRFACQVIDMMVPPLALLVMLQMLVLVASGLGWWLAGWVVPLGIAGVGAAMLVGAVLIARHRFAADILSLSELLCVPFYVTAKLPLYARFLWNRQVEWIRTARNTK